MGLYSFFRFSGSEFFDTLERACVDDLEALDAARNLCADHTVEVYDKKRFVAQVKKADEPVNVRDGASRKIALKAHIEDVQNQTHVAGGQTRQRGTESRQSLAQDREACSSSMDAVHRSRDTLARIDERGLTPWDPMPLGRGAK